MCTYFGIIREALGGKNFVVTLFRKEDDGGSELSHLEGGNKGDVLFGNVVGDRVMFLLMNVIHLERVNSVLEAMLM